MTGKQGKKEMPLPKIFSNSTNRLLKAKGAQKKKAPEISLKPTNELIGPRPKKRKNAKNSGLSRIRPSDINHLSKNSGQVFSALQGFMPFIQRTRWAVAESLSACSASTCSLVCSMSMAAVSRAFCTYVFSWRLRSVSAGFMTDFFRCKGCSALMLLTEISPFPCGRLQKNPMSNTGLSTMRLIPYNSPLYLIYFHAGHGPLIEQIKSPNFWAIRPPFSGRHT